MRTLSFQHLFPCFYRLVGGVILLVCCLALPTRAEESRPVASMAAFCARTLARIWCTLTRMCRPPCGRSNGRGVLQPPLPLFFLREGQSAARPGGTLGGEQRRENLYLHAARWVKFHCGALVQGRPGACTDLDATDVQWSIDKIRHKEFSRRAGYFSAIERIEAVDPLTVRMHLHQPDAGLLSKLAVGWAIIFPSELPGTSSKRPSLVLARSSGRNTLLAPVPPQCATPTTSARATPAWTECGILSSRIQRLPWPTCGPASSISTHTCSISTLRMPRC